MKSRRSNDSGWRRRATALGLTLLAELFFLILLLGLNPALLPKRDPPPEPVLLDIAENSHVKQAPKPKSVAKAKAAPKAAATPVRAPQWAMERSISHRRSGGRLGRPPPAPRPRRVPRALRVPPRDAGG